MEKFVNIHDAAEGLKAGKTLLYPTDTVWGLGCDATNEEAIKKIEKVKHRSKEKSFILLVDSIVMLERYVRDIPDVCFDLIEVTDKPLTIIYDNPMNLPASLLATDGSIGIRVTEDLNCMKLIQRLRKPLVSTSANISGQKTATSFEDIHEEIKNDVDLILNDRLKEIMKNPSTIIKVASNGNVKIIR